MYLVLVGQYESFLLPLAVITSLPVGIFGSFLFLKAMGLANDVYCQIGLVMLVGLLGKKRHIDYRVCRANAATKDRALSMPRRGAQLRFRPILMTSFAFIAGLIPLVRATGPGAIGNPDNRYDGSRWDDPRNPHRCAGDSRIVLHLRQAL